MPEFKGFPKLSRLFRTCTVTEKLDGTNAAIVLCEMEHEGDYDDDGLLCCIERAGKWYAVYAQSRKRFITPENDNYGFARWVQENAFDLAELGDGRHFGEWWGNGIQRKYGLSAKRFSLFNPDTEYTTDKLHTVPILYQGEFDQAAIEKCLTDLRDGGSVAAPGFPEPEGIVVYHHHGRHSYKITLDNEDRHKWEVE